MNSFRFRFRSPPTPEEEAQEARRRRADVETSRGNARWQISVEGRAGMDPRGDDGDAGTPPSDRARRVSSDPGEHARVGTTRPGTETRAEVRAVGGCKHRHRGGALPETGARANAALAPIAASRQDVGAATFAVVPEITHTKNATADMLAFVPRQSLPKSIREDRQRDLSFARFFLLFEFQFQ